VFDVESELSTIHFSLGHGSFFLKKIGGEGQKGKGEGGSKQRVPNSTSLFIPFAKANVVLLSPI
jgi:hypothetical protein